MDHFHYAGGVLHADGIPVPAIAEAAGTPTYIYAAATLREHYDRLAAAFAPLNPLICFAIKSCANLEVVRELVARGAGVDIVSGGELHRAQLAGADPATCVYAGVGKTDAEIRAAIAAGVGWFNIESEAEFDVIAEIAADMGAVARGALRINPDVDPKTHRYTTTGTRETKFGVDLERARRFFETRGANPHCRLAGIHLHIGSPVYDIGAYERALDRALALMDELERDLGHRIEMLDLGGGFGADYESGQSPIAAAYAERLVPKLQPRVEAGLQVVLEPGRTIAANAGILLVRVLYTKTSGDKTFIIVDGGMNVLMRPCHYGAFHFMWPVKVAAEHVPIARRQDMGPLPGLVRCDVVGPICESGDFLAEGRELPPLERGDLLAVFTAGAYGMVMANHYNAVPLPAEVMVDGSELTLVRRRETMDDLVAAERSPASLAWAPSV
ncbi:MAG: diaminopimelate decarboxylase [Phycisphaerales bacterium]